MEALKARLTSMVGQLFSQSTLTEAINYALNHWDGLTLFLSDGRVEVDTNTVERSMRPIAMGSRNSLFSGNEGGAESWAILASLVNTAKLNELDPQAYLADVLERIVSGRTKSHQLHELLAWNWKAARERSAQVGRMSRRRHAASSSMAAAAMPLDELERWLQDRADRHPVATSIPMLDGYVTAIVAGPVSISPPDWICPLLAIDADAFNHGGTPEFAAISAVVRAPQRHQQHALDGTAAVQADLPIQTRRRGGRPPLVPRLLCRHEIAPAGMVAAALSRQPRLPPALARAAVLRRRKRPTGRPRDRCGCCETTSASSSRRHSGIRRGNPSVLDAHPIQAGDVIHLRGHLEPLTSTAPSTGAAGAAR